MTTDTTTIDAIRDLLENLGHELKDVASIEITSRGYIRVIGNDRSLRSHRIAWPNFTKEESR